MDNNLMEKKQSWVDVIGATLERTEDLLRKMHSMSKGEKMLIRVEVGLKAEITDATKKMITMMEIDLAEVTQAMLLTSP